MPRKPGQRPSPIYPGVLSFNPTRPPLAVDIQKHTEFLRQFKEKRRRYGNESEEVLEFVLDTVKQYPPAYDLWPELVAFRIRLRYRNTSSANRFTHDLLDAYSENHKIGARSSRQYVETWRRNANLFGMMARNHLKHRVAIGRAIEDVARRQHVGKDLLKDLWEDLSRYCRRFKLHRVAGRRYNETIAFLLNHYPPSKVPPRPRTTEKEPVLVWNLSASPSPLPMYTTHYVRLFHHLSNRLEKPGTTEERTKWISQKRHILKWLGAQQQFLKEEKLIESIGNSYIRYRTDVVPFIAHMRANIREVERFGFTHPPD